MLILDEPLARSICATSARSSSCLTAPRRSRRDHLVVAHDLNPLLGVLSGAIYLLDGHAHYDASTRWWTRACSAICTAPRSKWSAHRQGDLYMRSVRMTTRLRSAMGYQRTGGECSRRVHAHGADRRNVVALAAGLCSATSSSSAARVRRPRPGPHRFPGATGAVLLGVPVALGLGVFCVGGALVIGLLGSGGRTRGRDRTILALATGFGLFFNSLATKKFEHDDERAVREPARDLARAADDVRGAIGGRWQPALASSTGRCCSPRSTRKSPRPRACRCACCRWSSWRSSALPSPWRSRRWAPCCSSRCCHPGGDGDHADASRPRRWPSRPASAWCGCGRPRVVGDVQPAAELRHHHDRLQHWFAVRVVRPLAHVEPPRPLADG